MFTNLRIFRRGLKAPISAQMKDDEMKIYTRSTLHTLISMSIQLDDIQDSDDPVWLDDGNVILRSGVVMHRVHRSVLEKHSIVFRRVFEQRKMLHGDHESPPVLSVSDNVDSLLHYVRARYNEDRSALISDRPR